MNFRELHKIEEELRKRLDYPYIWGRKQNDLWDRHSGFIYNTPGWEEVLELARHAAVKHGLEQKAFLDYTANRWYNFRSAKAVEAIFRNVPGVLPVMNEKDRLRDFNLKGMDVDLKTSVFPQGFGHDLHYAKDHPRELISWLYNNQSSQQRMHLANRLFLIVYTEGGEHWKLKAEISLIKQVIEDYVANFDPQKMLKFEFHPGKTTYSDVIWLVK
ncbi:MAG TPA: hypothetical protein VK941_12975 [Gillisia sp.]|nr:hypothetical protein [Gillisia sp.]